MESVYHPLKRSRSEGFQLSNSCVLKVEALLSSLRNLKIGDHFSCWYEHAVKRKEFSWAEKALICHGANQRELFYLVWSALESGEYSDALCFSGMQAETLEDLPSKLRPILINNEHYRTNAFFDLIFYSYELQRQNDINSAQTLYRLAQKILSYAPIESQILFEEPSFVRHESSVFWLDTNLDAYKMSALQFATYFGLSEVALSILEKFPSLVRSLTRGGVSLLSLALLSYCRKKNNGAADKKGLKLIHFLMETSEDHFLFQQKFCEVETYKKMREESGSGRINLYRDVPAFETLISDTAPGCMELYYQCNPILCAIEGDLLEEAVIIARKFPSAWNLLLDSKEVNYNPLFVSARYNNLYLVKVFLECFPDSLTEKSFELAVRKDFSDEVLALLIDHWFTQKKNGNSIFDLPLKLLISKNRLIFLRFIQKKSIEKEVEFFPICYYDLFYVTEPDADINNKEISNAAMVFFRENFLLNFDRFIDVLINSCGDIVRYLKYKFSKENCRYILTAPNSEGYTAFELLARSIGEIETREIDLCSVEETIREEELKKIGKKPGYFHCPTKEQLCDYLVETGGLRRGITLHEFSRYTTQKQVYRDLVEALTQCEGFRTAKGAIED